MMFLASLVESSAWAVAFMRVEAFTEFEPAFYFSTVTFTTLGYGDVLIHDRWRLLATFEAANGIIMFGWTTALIVATVQRVYVSRERIEEADTSR
jgi:voltage-gated potassium channel Kch